MDVFVARQPIFNRKKEVEYYELLFRNSNINQYSNIDSFSATLSVLKNSFSIIGFDKLTEGKKAFVNCDEQMLKSGIIETFPKELVTIEILETVRPTDEIIDICKRLKNKGYIIALDDYEFDDAYRELFKYVDIIKVDFILTKGEERKKIMDSVGIDNIKYLAEKVETEEEYELALKYGYEYFQGYFFCKPTIIKGKEINSYSTTYLRLIDELNKKDINFNNVENIIKGDLGIAYKLLKIVNSASYGLKNEVKSIKQAIALIGISELRKWVYITNLKSLSLGKPEELVKLSLIRASFGEKLISIIKGTSSFDMFLTGLFSLIDAFLNVPINEAITDLPVSYSVKDALIGKENELELILDLILNYEKANWENVKCLIAKLGINEVELAESYIEAVEWVRSFNL